MAVFVEAVGEEAGLDVDGAHLDLFNRKFEANFVVVEFFVFLHVSNVDLCDFVEAFFGFASAVSLHLTERFGILLALAAEAAFLNAQVV